MADADELAVAKSNLDLAQQTLDVYQGRLDAGTATALDVAQQQATVAEQEAAIPADQSALEQELVALGILVGETPEELKVTPGTLTSLAVPAVGAGLPSELLARRPDVADAEAQLRAANQNIGVARAAFFPSFNLTGSSGFQSQALNKLLVPGALSLSLGSSFSQVIFDNGELTGQLESAHGQYDQYAAAYHKAVLQALTDVEDALIGLRYTTEQERLQQIAYDISARANDIAHEQMEAGTVDITTVLDTENTLRSNQLTLVQVRLSRFNALITLFKALGGGWSETDVAAMKG
jgi:NodT family efflux transporter outer membrane factor (OMF) lipoprotein